MAVWCSGLAIVIAGALIAHASMFAAVAASRPMVPMKFAADLTPMRLVFGQLRDEMPIFRIPPPGTSLASQTSGQMKTSSWQ
jgi:hypothetical protein